MSTEENRGGMGWTRDRRKRWGEERGEVRWEGGGGRWEGWMIRGGRDRRGRVGVEKGEQWRRSE